MSSTQEYISDSEIISHLCRERAKIAKVRDRKHRLHLLTSNPIYNYHKNKSEEYQKELSNLLSEILPKRKQWKELNAKARAKNGQPLNSLEKNVKALKITIDFFNRSNPEEPFLKKLNQFIADIRESVSRVDFQICNPDIRPKPKEEKKSRLKHLSKSNDDSTICRPISLFNLKDKIIISLTNKYLTRLFDRYFYRYSFAFRAKHWENEKWIYPTHHDAIKIVKEYLERHKDGELWVAECDIMKFYDTVNHSVAKRALNRFLGRVKKDNPNIDLSAASRVFYSYLNCYSFPTSILPLNDQPQHFKQFRIRNGQYAWVKDELLRENCYKCISRIKMGVPQGGALSGLIANIVLDLADRRLLKLADKDLLYVRYCDDMLIIHPDLRVCQMAFDTYNRALKDLKLIPYPASKHLVNSSESFWKVKSKSPYKWCKNEVGAFPWIGFVGYEIHRDGHVRVRKRSLKKEMEKQYEIVNEVKKAIEKNQKRVRNKSIEESVINRLIGMSVGRVNIWNANNIKNEMCWANGFRELTPTKYAKIQLRRLDAVRNKLIRRLKKQLEADGDFKPKKERKHKGDLDNLDYYGKPFSYYYHVIERKQKK